MISYWRNVIWPKLLKLEQGHTASGRLRSNSYFLKIRKPLAQETRKQFGLTRIQSLRNIRRCGLGSSTTASKYWGGIRKEILKQDSKANISDEAINPHLNAAVVELWQNVGLKESAQGKRSEALEKMKKEVERIEKEL